MTIDTDEVTVTDLRQVTLHFVSGSRNTHIMRVTDVSAFVEASIKLHHTPGRNPATGAVTSKIYAITSSRLGFSKPFWWTSPSLDSDDPTGSRVLESTGQDEILFHDINALADEAIHA